MSETEVVWVGGMGTRLRSSRMEALLKEGGYTSHLVEGIHSTTTGTIEVSSPSYQREKLTAICQETSKKKLLISHCSGALAVVRVLEETTSNLSGLLIAPPLSEPIDVLTSPFVQRTIQEINDTQYAYVDDLLPVEDEPPTKAAIPTGYYDEVNEASPDFYSTVKRLVGEGVLKLVIPTRDWNKSAVTATTGGWPEPGKALYLDARHDLSVPRQPTIQSQNYLEALRFIGR